MQLTIPKALSQRLSRSPEGSAWLNGLPQAVEEVMERWALTLGAALTEHATCSWVARCTTQEGDPAVLKLGLPHMEAAHEIDGLLFWAGRPTVHMLNHDRHHNALLLECCEPGRSLHSLPEEKQDVVLADLLRELWHSPEAPPVFRPISDMLHAWSTQARQNALPDTDIGLLEEGSRLLAELTRTSTNTSLLATDLHAGNVLRAERRPWLVIDPKPFVGDPAYDATQHLLNAMGRLTTRPHQTVERFADLLELSSERINYGSSPDWPSLLIAPYRT